MKKNVLFALICASVFGFAFSSCSSDDGGIVDEASVKTRASAVVSGAKGEVYLVYTDYISDVNDEYGVIRVDYFNGNTYIDCANGNRYYFAGTGEFVLDIQPMLEKAGILVEGTKVKFSGKVYDTDERWIPDLEWRLENYGWNDGAKEAASHGLYNYELPTAGQTFWLVTPDFTITKAE